VQLGDPGGRGGADGDAVDQTGNNKPGQIAPYEKENSTQRGDEQRRDQHSAGAVPIGDMADCEEREYDGQCVDRADDRDLSEPKPSRAPESSSSGVGTAKKPMMTANAAATGLEPPPCSSPAGSDWEVPVACCVRSARVLKFAPEGS
jgi:hypothetical protein